MDFLKLPDWVGYIMIGLMFIGAATVLVGIACLVIWAINHVKII